MSEHEDRAVTGGQNPCPEAPRPWRVAAAEVEEEGWDIVDANGVEVVIVGNDKAIADLIVDAVNRGDNAR